MRKFILFSLSAAFTLASVAQEAPKASDSHDSTEAVRQVLQAEIDQTQLVGINGMNCPVWASAERSGTGAVIQTRAGGAVNRESELHLHFFAAKRSAIAEATITLHGTDSRPHAELTSLSPAAYLTEEFHLSGTAEHALTAAWLNPTRVVNVRWIGISELKFVDGSSWHASTQSYCHIQPNGFRLIDSTR